MNFEIYTDIKDYASETLSYLCNSCGVDMDEAMKNFYGQVVDSPSASEGIAQGSWISLIIS